MYKEAIRNIQPLIRVEMHFLFCIFLLAKNKTLVKKVNKNSKFDYELEIFIKIEICDKNKIFLSTLPVIIVANAITYL